MQIHKGHYECESDCIYYQACKVCAHIVAIAMKNGDLNSFLSWHKKRNHQVNTTAIAQSDLPLTSVGKKKSARKGISKQKSAKIRKICAETDDSSWNLRPALANATTVQNQLAMSVNVQSSSLPVIMPSQSSVIVPSQTYGHSSQLFPQDFAIFPAPSAQFYYMEILVFVQGAASNFLGIQMVIMLTHLITWPFNTWNPVHLTAPSLACQQVKLEMLITMFTCPVCIPIGLHYLVVM